ncbi:hypothetical protein LF887_18785 [Chryseobacterium sp. MEBOG06]|uniref:hypothetical protein n=1 Tax=Chryseobacterium sp. MEBOG06 TaxID=2879938 RepID=UPI001F185457|nr:hypothetical protein [Chryseobacterium sp. MEBOG06]UKB83038.1 hypothetical protein LF887_18785 [Chryseobacterium sp. MEBOG06]
MKRKNVLFFLLISSLGFAQVGVNTTSPKATLDVALPAGYTSGTKAGIAFPQLSGNDIESIDTTGLKSGTLVYSTSASTASVKDVTGPGYWYWKDATDKWEPVLVNAPKFFYSPSIPINTAVSSGTTETIDLYTNYTGQFSTPMASSTGASGSIPVYAANALEYYVTWYDTSIFENVAIDAAGKLTYSVLSTADTSKPTYMNVVFVVK